MKNLAKNNPVSQKLTVSKILPVFLLASMTLSSLQINSMDRVSNSSRIVSTITLGLGTLAVAYIYKKCLNYDPSDYINPEDCKLTIVDSSNSTPLSMTSAIRMCDIELCRQLITDGADVNAKSGSLTPLMRAAFSDHDIELCKLLITAGADVNVKCHNYTVLDYAIDTSNTELCKLLITAGAEIPDHLREHPQILAISETLRNKPALIRALTSPYPKQAGHLITLININELLRTHDINSFIGDPAEKTTLLMLVAERGIDPETPAIIAELVRRGANINAQDSYGRTALHRVFTAAHKQYKRVNITNASGEIVAVQVIGCGIDRSPEVTTLVVKQLLDGGIDVFIKDKGLEADWNPSQEPGFERNAFTYAGIVTPNTEALLLAAGAHYDSRLEWKQTKARRAADEAKASMLAKLAEMPSWVSEDL